MSEPEFVELAEFVKMTIVCRFSSQHRHSSTPLTMTALFDKNFEETINLKYEDKLEAGEACGCGAR